MVGDKKKNKEQRMVVVGQSSELVIVRVFLGCRVM